MKANSTAEAPRWSRSKVRRDLISVGLIAEGRRGHQHGGAVGELTHGLAHHRGDERPLVEGAHEHDALLLAEVELEVVRIDFLVDERGAFGPGRLEAAEGAHVDGEVVLAVAL